MPLLVLHKPRYIKTTNRTCEGARYRTLSSVLLVILLFPSPAECSRIHARVRMRAPLLINKSMSTTRLSRRRVPKPPSVYRLAGTSRSRFHAYLPPPQPFKFSNILSDKCFLFI